MHRFTIQRKIRDTVLGATYECTYNAPPLPPRPTLIDPRRPRPPPNPQRPRAPVVLKCSSPVAHKRLAAALAQSRAPEVLDDPLRERDVVAALIASGGHDHVLQCYDQFTTQDETTGDECVCIVTEYCHGGDLFSYLSKATSSSGLSERECVSLMLQVARGVAFLQSRLGLAHRDLSLENVFLRDGICKVADFGAAMPLHPKCVDRVGKRPYMAPEVVVSSPSASYDPSAADVWSLGVMLFILLTGSPLVDVASSEDPRFDALTQHGVGAILSAWGFVVSSDVVELLAAMLHTDPTQRPTVTELVATLHAVQSAIA